MKYFLLISLIASCVFAQTTLSPKHLPAAKPTDSAVKHSSPIPAQATEKARFIYREFLANREDSFIIQAIKCNPAAKNELWIEQFKTDQKVSGGEVHTLHIYARAGDCTQSPVSSVWFETIKIPKSNKMTHVYITILSNNITVQ
ncbi:hypothetical protein [Pseudobdellovibrio sp. HCB154]|uniref:hypothetical protein n=1 Tax=Pseudobdellovibrio sp. HCB154 TaxID=3386277 RepID=UPI0039175751